jgi:MFS transporter, SET family, sugar efflux transporter
MRGLLQRCRPLYTNRDFRLVVALNVLLGLAYSFVVPFMSMFGTLEVGMSKGLFGVFMATTAVSGIFLGTVLAHYSDVRFSRRAMLLLGSFCGAAGYVGYAYIRDFYGLIFIGSIVLGISSISFSQVFALAREYLARSDISKTEGPFYMNAFRMFFALSWTVGPAIASWMMVGYSYEGLFLAAAGTFFLLFLVVWKFVPPGFGGGSQPQKSAAKGSLIPLLKRADVLAHFSALVLVFASGTIGMMNLPLLTIQVLGGTEKHVGIMYSVAPVFELPLMLYFGMLATKRDSAKIIQVGIFLAVIYYALLSIVQAPWHVYPAQILSAAVVAVTSGVAITYFQNYLPHHAGTATNLYSTAQRIGGTMGYLLFGTLSGTFGYRGVFVGCTAFCLISIALMHVPAKPDTPDS